MTRRNEPTALLRNTLLQRLDDFWKKHPQVSKNQRFLLAVSGGRDSIVLADLFFHSALDFQIAHCNFHLRGTDSDRDEAFVRQLAQRYNVPLFVQHFDTKTYAETQKISIEEAARTLRYQWFNTLLADNSLDWLVTAHHQNDSIETFFLNLLRGTGLSGLHGILPIRNQLLRPMIDMSDEEIANYVAINNLDYCTDQTNFDTTFTRNRIRHRLLPVFRDFFPPDNNPFAARMNDTIHRLQGTEKIYRQAIQQIRNQIVTENSDTTEIDISALLQTADPSTVLYELIAPYGFKNRQINAIFQTLCGESGRIFYSPNWQLVKDRKSLIISKIEANSERVYLLETLSGNCTEPLSLVWETLAIDEQFQIPKTADVACFDADLVRFPLTLRRWKEGDYFVPFGMSGRKKLSDFFSDHKFSLWQKQQTWILCSGVDILWVVGHRTDNRFRISDKTKRVIKFQITDNQ